MFDLVFVAAIAAGLYLLHRRFKRRTGTSTAYNARRAALVQWMWAIGMVLAIMVAIRLAGGGGWQKMIVVLPLAVAVFAVVYVIVRTSTAVRQRVVNVMVRILGSDVVYQNRVALITAGIAATIALVGVLALVPDQVSAPAIGSESTVIEAATKDARENFQRGIRQMISAPQGGASPAAEGLENSTASHSDTYVHHYNQEMARQILAQPSAP